MDAKVKEVLSGAGVDLERTLERFLNNEALYEKFLRRFPTDPNYESLQKAMESRDLEEIERAAHTLKGVSANLGLDPVAQVMNEIVQAVRTHQEEKLDGLFVKMQEKYDVFKGIIEQYYGQK